jgi:chorismate mutase
MSTNLLASLSAKQLRQAAAIREQIDTLDRQLANLLSTGTALVQAAPAAKATAARTKKKRTMSPEARARISAAQKKRWTKIKAANKKA